MYTNPDNLLDQLRSALRYKRQKLDYEYNRDSGSHQTYGLRTEIMRMERLIRVLSEDSARPKSSDNIHLPKGEPNA